MYGLGSEIPLQPNTETVKLCRAAFVKMGTRATRVKISFKFKQRTTRTRKYCGSQNLTNNPFNNFTAVIGTVLRPSIQLGTALVLAATLFCAANRRAQGLNRLLASERHSGYGVTVKPSVVYTNLSQVSPHASDLISTFSTILCSKKPILSAHKVFRWAHLIRQSPNIPVSPSLYNSLLSEG